MTPPSSPRAGRSTVSTAGEPTNLDTDRLRRIFDEHDLWGLIAKEYGRLDPDYQATLPTIDDVRGLLSRPATTTEAQTLLDRTVLDSERGHVRPAVASPAGPEATPLDVPRLAEALCWWDNDGAHRLSDFGSKLRERYEHRAHQIAAEYARLGASGAPGEPR